MIGKSGLLGLALAGATAAAGSSAQTHVPMPTAPSNGIAPARPGEVAIREEFEAARRTGTAEAYDIFIARHSNHPLAHRARQERDRLATGSKGK